jgi:hypothetical protein
MSSGGGNFIEWNLTTLLRTSTSAIPVDNTHAN